MLGRVQFRFTSKGWSERQMKSQLRSALIAASVLGVPFNAAAERPEQFVADAARGELVAVKLCSSCHIVRADQTSGVVAGVPSFRAMTKLPRQRINRQLITPHAPMPNMQLTLKEIADILAFVEALRREAAGEPGIAPAPRKKPIYPSPS